ncbi:hypothetical protein [Pseudomonas sp. SWRI154]|uniref:hypothetical protein n=1 Tax=Pseudomonas sp. SWRI154 TaxID=2745501 RepID=UPI00164755AA|nr:hypothetical protein [Pseudomonas sp. SWRI154]MBC3363238.1 hypothetical protein [Pseudomonas sp. SWRI154]
MNTPLFSSYSERLVALKNTRVDFAVQVLLGDRLEVLDLSPHSTYLNTLTDLADVTSATSRTLFDEALACVEKQRLPHYTQGISNIFNKRYSFADEDRVKALDIIAFEKIVTDIVLELTEKPPMELSLRPIRSLSAEELHGALKAHLPGSDLNEVYVTDFVPHDVDTQVISSSKSLVEYLLDHFINDDIPYHVKGNHQGIYTAAFSGEDRDLHPRLGIHHLNDLVIRIVADFLD